MKFRLCHPSHWQQSRIRQLVAVDIVAKSDDFVAQMLNVLSTLLYRVYRALENSALSFLAGFSSTSLF